MHVWPDPMHNYAMGLVPRLGPTAIQPAAIPTNASTGNRPVTGACIGGDSGGACYWCLQHAIGGDGGSDFIVLELPRTGRAVCGNKPAVLAACIHPSGL